MPSEAQMWTALRPHMAQRNLDPVRVENPALPGTPDVNYINGWAELKHADRWPPRGGPLRLKHPPTTEQQVWLYRRWHKGGVSWLILRVGRMWFVIRGCDVKALWGSGDPRQAQIEETAVFIAAGPSFVAEFLAGADQC